MIECCRCCLFFQWQSLYEKRNVKKKENKIIMMSNIVTFIFINLNINNNK